MTGRVVHFEVPYEDAERAQDFYKGVFDWQLQSMPEMSYTIVTTGPAGPDGMPGEPGYIGGGMFQREEPLRSPVIVMQVDDIDATLAEIERRGGSTAKEKMPVGDMGFAAYFNDPEGNLLGLWQNAG